MSVTRIMTLLCVAGGLLLSGCAEKYYKVPKDEYRVRVQTLGVLPLLVDTESLGIYPEPAELKKVLVKNNLGKADRLVDKLREVKGYFDIRKVDGDPAALYRQLVAGGELSSGEPLSRHYRFDPQAVRELANRNGVDALLVIIINGVSRDEKRWDRTHLTYLRANFDMLLATAEVVTAGGEVVWEFPGYAAEAFVPLQYPDFDEAHYNLSERVKVKDITVVGVDRMLSEPDKSLFGSTAFAKRYRDLFDNLTAALNPGGPLPSLPQAPAREK